jgi:hypothetical protein
MHLRPYRRRARPGALASNAAATTTFLPSFCRGFYGTLAMFCGSIVQQGRRLGYPAAAMRQRVRDAPNT